MTCSRCDQRMAKDDQVPVIAPDGQYLIVHSECREDGDELA